MSDTWVRAALPRRSGLLHPRAQGALRRRRRRATATSSVLPAPCSRWSSRSSIRTWTASTSALILVRDRARHGRRCASRPRRGHDADAAAGGAVQRCRRCRGRARRAHRVHRRRVRRAWPIPRGERVHRAGRCRLVQRIGGHVPQAPGAHHDPPGRRAVRRWVSIGVAAAAVVLAVAVVPTGSTGLLVALALVSLVLGVLFVLPVGGADVPIVISLLNAFTGLTVAASGYVLDNVLLLVAGTFVGASGTLLTRMMATAMGRPLTKTLFGAFCRDVDRWAAAWSATARCAPAAPRTWRSCWRTPARWSSSRATDSRSPRGSTRCASSPTCSASEASTSSTASTPWPAGCPAT